MLRLRTFGGAALLEDDRALEGPAAQKRRIALLALLAVAAGRGISRDKLAACLWPESETERARHSLSQWMFTTRRDLKADDLFLGTTELRINPDRLWTDTAEFERAIGAGDLETAVALYAGPFLDGFHIGGASEFERWLDGERERFARMYGDALEQLAERRASAGDLRGAVDAWRRLAATDPYNGRTALSLMRALVSAGDTAGALTHARVHATLLREELGAEPQPEITAYAEQLRLSPPAREPAAAPAVVRTPGPAAETTADTDAAPAQPAPAPAPPAAPPASAASTLSQLRRRRRVVRRAALFAAPVLLLAIIGAFYSVPPEDRARALILMGRRFQGAETVPRRVVVAALENHTGDPSLTTFGFMAADYITEGLTATGEFDVVDARTSALTRMVIDSIPRALRANDPAIALAQHTEAELLISGRYYLESDSLRVHVTMTDVASRKVLRTPASRIVQPLANKQGLVNEVVRRVVAMAATAVDTTAAGLWVGRVLPPSYEAYAEAKRAWDSYVAGDTPEFFRRAQRAAAMDTTYMAPLALQAHVRAEARQWAQVDTLVRILEARRERLSEIERIGTDMLAAAVRGDLTAQQRGALAIVRAAPASQELRTHAARLSVDANRPNEALQILAGVNPRAGVMLAQPWYWNLKAAANHLIGDHSAELAAARQGRRLFPHVYTAVGTWGRAIAVQGKEKDLHELMNYLPAAGTPEARRRWKIALDWGRELRAHGYPSQAHRLTEAVLAQLERAPADTATTTDRFRAKALGDLGRWAEARALWERIASSEPGSLEAQGYRALAAARSGDTATAREIDRRLAAWGEPYMMGRDAMWRARVAAALGETQRAVTLVEIALASGHHRFFDPGGGAIDEPELHADPALETLRGLPAFRALLQPKG